MPWPEKASRPPDRLPKSRAGPKSSFVSLPTPEVVRSVALGARRPDPRRRDPDLRRSVDHRDRPWRRRSPPRWRSAASRRWMRRSRAAYAASTQGTLAVMVAGPAPELERMRPLLEVFGRVFHVGEAGRPRPVDEARRQFPLGDCDRSDRRSRGARGQGRPRSGDNAGGDQREHGPQHRERGQVLRARS